MPALPLKSDPTSYSSANRKSQSCSIQRIYPWLLFASTAVSATFCLAYITKPVVFSEPSPAILSQIQLSEPQDFSKENQSISEQSESQDASETPLLDGPDSYLKTRSNSPQTSDFEETNIRIQHVLDAEFPSGDISRIIVDVPVLYRSRSLRWNQGQTDQARLLVDRLAVYQNQIRSLRSEGDELLKEWNELLSESIPGAALRADSPSLPANQQDDFTPGSNRGSDTVDTIRIQLPEE